MGHGRRDPWRGGPIGGLIAILEATHTRAREREPRVYERRANVYEDVLYMVHIQMGKLDQSTMRSSNWKM